MPKFGGYAGGMPGNMSNLMKQAQRMQRQMEEKKKNLQEQTFSGTAGGGAVKIEMSGARKVLSVHIDPDACDPEDVETLQDMIVVAANNVLEQIEKADEEAMGALTGGLGGFGL